MEYLLTLSQPTVRVLRHSICRQQTGEYQHRSCSFCRIYEDELSLSVQSQSQGHLTLGQTPKTKDKWYFHEHSWSIKVMRNSNQFYL